MTTNSFDSQIINKHNSQSGAALFAKVVTPIDTKEQSDQETIFSEDKKYSECINALREENQFQREAISTAENLISTYQNENARLLRENQALKREQMRVLSEKIELKRHLEAIQEVLVRLSQYSKNKSIAKFDLNQMVRPNSKYLQRALESIIQQQSRYEQTIFDLNQKLSDLEKISHRSKNSNQQTKRLKTQCWQPNSDASIKQKILRCSIDEQNFSFNKKTARKSGLSSTKHYQVKKNLDKQFQEYVMSRKKENCQSLSQGVNLRSTRSASAYSSSAKRRENIRSASKR